MQFIGCLPNNDMGNAFCAPREFVSGETASLNVVLHRSLSQFNVYTLDMDRYDASSVDNPVKTIRLKFHGVPVKMGIVQGVADENGYVPFRVKDTVHDYKFSCDVLIGATQTYSDKLYNHLSMNYILVPASQSITDVSAHPAWAVTRFVWPTY